MDFYEASYQRYTLLSTTLPDLAAQKAASTIAAYLTTGRDIISLYHKALSQAKEQQGEAATLYKEFANQIECRFSPLTYTGDYCSFCGALNSEQLQAFLMDALARVTTRLLQEALVVDAYSTFLEEQTDEEILCLSEIARTGKT